MLDFKYIYNTAEGVLGTTNMDLLPWQGIDYVNTGSVRELAQMGLMSWVRPGEVRLCFQLDKFDLPPTPSPVNHRYWPPGYAGGRDFMTRMPKCEIFFMERYLTGEPMLIRFYFWANKEKMDSFTSEPTYDQVMSAVSDIVNVVIPIPEAQWAPPVWLPLPATLSISPMMRVKALMSQQK